MKLKSSSLKLNLELEPYIVKKQRTKRRRRVRSQFSLITLPRKNEGFSVFSVDSSSCSYFGDEVSCDSSRVTAESNVKKRKCGEARRADQRIEFDEAPFRRITRSYQKQKVKEKKEKESEKKGQELVEVSESSCVESSCVDVFGENKNNNRAENAKEVQVNFNKLGSKTIENDTVSAASAAESCLSHRTIQGGRAVETELSETSKNDTVSFDDEFVADQQQKKPNNLEGMVAEADLACTEQLSYDDVVSDYSSSFGNAFSEFFDEQNSSELEFSDYTPSSFFDSGSQFSVGDDSTPSQTYSLLLQFRQQFSRSTSPFDATRSSSLLEPQDYVQYSACVVRFEEEEDEESYQRLRERERRQVFLHDYAEFYRSTTEDGDLILQQRSKMVHWIVEQSTAKEFQQETMFLGVSLLDRFLSKGFFKNKRNLQIVGIACLALATRIEENQPYNSVRQKNFYIGKNVYGRCEVVAMEWLVQEVLNFKCFLPTICNFMWFYLKAARADAVMEKRARYLAVLALSDHEQLRHWPSAVAAGLVILASLESNQIECYERVIQVHVRTKENDLHECVKKLEWLLQYMS